MKGNPSVAEEIAESVAVVIGEVVKSNDKQGDPSDPSGITGTLFEVVVQEALVGKVPDQIRVYSENTSARFPMELGHRYVLFLYGSQDELQVDGCGNSAELNDASRTVAEVRWLAQKK